MTIFLVLKTFQKSTSVPKSPWLMVLIYSQSCQPWHTVNPQVCYFSPICNNPTLPTVLPKFISKLTAHICDLLWQTREHVRATSCTIFCLLQSELTYLELWNSLSITKAYLGWTIVKWITMMQINNAVWGFCYSDGILINILPGWMHRVYWSNWVQVKSDTSALRHVPRFTRAGYIWVECINLCPVTYHTREIHSNM